MPEQTSESLEQAVTLLLEQNARARADLLEAIDALPSEAQTEGWYGDGQWSVKDILAHIIGWQFGWTHALEDIAQGERPHIPEFEGDEDAYNHRSVENRRDHPWAQVLSELRYTRERHEAAVRGLVGRVDEERFQPGRTAYRLADAGAHDREHIPAIKEWRRQRGL